MNTVAVKRLFAAAFVLGILLSLPVLSLAQEGDPIVIGGGFGLTGGMASLDVPASNGALLAV
ncbi:MAG: ABC transporter substrate-binding protein, partial [Burkholderiales bacterium]|nr:ABC transporter substrate-binding protein [Anaerolineae bacterium]